MSKWFCAGCGVQIKKKSESYFVGTADCKRPSCKPCFKIYRAKRKKGLL